MDNNVDFTGKTKKAGKPVKTKGLKRTKIAMYMLGGLMLYIAGFSSHTTVQRYSSALKAVPAMASDKKVLIDKSEYQKLQASASGAVQHTDEEMVSPLPDKTNLKVR